MKIVQASAEPIDFEPYINKIESCPIIVMDGVSGALIAHRIARIPIYHYQMDMEQVAVKRYVAMLAIPIEQLSEIARFFNQLAIEEGNPCP